LENFNSQFDQNQRRNQLVSIYDSSWFSQKIEGCFKILVSYLAHSHIWLNLPVDGCQFGYVNTKFDQKNSD
jgi:hypothetical protein